MEIRFQDYRDVDDGPFDAISSIGMVEHVGAAQLAEYFGRLHDLLRPGGRLLNHGICWPRGSSGLKRTSFVANYVFPDGELHEVGVVAQAMQARGFEVRDDESLREHYALTLRHWVAQPGGALGRGGARRRRRARARVAALHGRLGPELRERQHHGAPGARPCGPTTTAGPEMPLTRAALLG